MKALIALVISSIVIAGCSKRDIVKWMDRNSRCDLADQSIIYYGEKEPLTRKLFENKTYYGNGMPKTLNIVFTGIFGDADTLQYSFDYSTNAALVHVKSTKRGGTLMTYDVNVTFDPKTRFATKIGNDVIVYEGERIKSYGTRQFFYDAYGNLTRVKYPAIVGVTSESDVRLGYDLTKKGGQQEFYSTLDFNLGSTYNMADLLGWIPTNGSPNRRISKEILSGDVVLAGEDYSDHQYKNGKLVQFNSQSRGSIIPDVIKNTWKCN